MTLKSLDSSWANGILAEAESSPRLRTHYNLHESVDEQVQRMCVSLDPGTYVRPHRHIEKTKDENKWELLIFLQGNLDLVLFDAEGKLSKCFSLGALADDKTAVVEIPPQTYHSLVVYEPSIILEVKQGPWQAPTVEEQELIFAPWAPAEQSDGVQKYCEQLQKAVQDFKVSSSKPFKEKTLAS
jgi:cupin fold WbuC family metalloprotein